MVAGVRILLRERIKRDALGEAHALGKSREPPPANLQSCHLTKRLPFQEDVPSLFLAGFFPNAR
jgi:hypothetical protein